MTEYLLFNCDRLLTTTTELLLSHIDIFCLLSSLAAALQPHVSNENHPLGGYRSTYEVVPSVFERQSNNLEG